jgi:hypothetical protein
MAYAQVGINTTSPTKPLDINGELRVRTLPIGLESDNILSTDTDGNIRKVSRADIGGGSSSGFSSTILGYVPQPVGARPQPPGPVPGGGTATEMGCKKWAENNHTYCAYQLSNSINWYNGFSFGKQMGGYLVTMTSDSERIWVNTNIVNPVTGYNLANNVWIGFNKITRPGTPNMLQWITGEEFKINWDTNPASTQNWFFPGEPTGGAEGSTHIFTATQSASRQWNDLVPTSITSYSSPMNQLIIEFNE